MTRAEQSKTKAEARAVVDEIIRRMSDEKLRNDSIGVVTFSSVQQNLIDDMLCEEWANHPELKSLTESHQSRSSLKTLKTSRATNVTLYSSPSAMVLTKRDKFQ